MAPAAWILVQFRHGAVAIRPRLGKYIATHDCYELLRHQNAKVLILLNYATVAGGPGFERRLTESEFAVLPLNYPPSRRVAPPSSAVSAR